MWGVVFTACVIFLSFDATNTLTDIFTVSGIRHTLLLQTYTLQLVSLRASSPRLAWRTTNPFVLASAKTHTAEKGGALSMVAVAAVTTRARLSLATCS